MLNNDEMLSFGLSLDELFLFGLSDLDLFLDDESGSDDSFMGFVFGFFKDVQVLDSFLDSFLDSLDYSFCMLISLDEFGLVIKIRKVLKDVKEMMLQVYKVGNIVGKFVVILFLKQKFDFWLFEVNFDIDFNFLLEFDSSFGLDLEFFNFVLKQGVIMSKGFIGIGIQCVQLFLKNLQNEVFFGQGLIKIQKCNMWRRCV